MESEVEDLKREIEQLKGQLHILHMKMGALKVILTYEAPVCREKLLECLIDSESCKEGFDHN